MVLSVKELEMTVNHPHPPAQQMRRKQNAVYSELSGASVASPPQSGGLVVIAVLLAFMGVCSHPPLCPPPAPLQVELHVHLDGAIKPETILYYGR